MLLAAAVLASQAAADPYRWLEDAHSPRTSQWIDLQNARAERTIDAYAGNARIAKRVEALALTGPQQYEPQISGSTMFYLREVPPQPQPVLMARPWPGGTPRVLVDPARIGPSVSLDDVWPSPCGGVIAIGTSSAGGESTTIRIVDASSGRAYRETLGPAGGGTTSPAVAWDANERGFTYGRLPPNGSQFNIVLYHHVLGTPQASDTLALHAISPVAEYQLLTSGDARFAAALVQFGDGSFYRVYVRNGKQWHPALGPQAGIVAGRFVGDRLFLVATNGSPRGRIVRLQPDGTLQTMVAQAGDWAYHDIAGLRSGFLVVKSWGTAWKVDQYDAAGHFVRTAGLPRSGIGIDGIASSSTQDTALIAYSGWTGPAQRWVTYDARTGSMRTAYDLKLPSAEYAAVRVRELAARSADGTRVPVTVLSLASTPANGTAPAILTGYGGFDIPTAPHFIGSELAWLEMGGVYAVANIRGGNEFGEDWHRQGMLSNKQHVFDDFYAAAQALVAHRLANVHRVGIEGGSNGGLLVGAAVIQHPQTYRAAVAAAGIFDMLRHQLFPNGAYNVTEYGDANVPQQQRVLYAYSPYHHVRKGTAYPAVLLITSENDPRVAPWQSWKFGAALEDATSSRNPIAVLTRRTGGHGHGESFAQRVGNAAVTLSFLAAQLGVHANGSSQP